MNTTFDTYYYYYYDASRDTDDTSNIYESLCGSSVWRNGQEGRRRRHIFYCLRVSHYTEWTQLFIILKCYRNTFTNMHMGMGDMI